MNEMFPRAEGTGWQAETRMDITMLKRIMGRYLS